MILLSSRHPTRKGDATFWSQSLIDHAPLFPWASEKMSGTLAPKQKNARGTGEDRLEGQVSAKRKLELEQTDLGRPSNRLRI